MTVSGGTVASTLSESGDAGALLLLCPASGTRALGALVSSGLVAVNAGDLAGLSFDEQVCRTPSGDFAAGSGSFSVSGNTVTFFDGSPPQNVGQDQLSSLMSASGSIQFQADAGTVRWRGWRRPGGGIVIVEGQTGGTGPSAEPAAVRVYLQR